MEESSSVFTARLQAALQEKRTFIVEEVERIIPEAVSGFTKSLETVTGSLINAGFLVDDPYSNSGSIHEIKMPPEEPILQESRMEEVSYRLANYLKQLDYIENDYDLSIDSLTLARIPEAINFFNYINWSRLSPTASSPTERAIAEIEQEIRTGDDNFVRGLFRDGRKQLADYNYRILCGLDDIRVYLSESYKLEIRNRVLPAIIIEPEEAVRRPDETLMEIRKEFKKEMSGQPFYPELIKEIILESFSGDAAAKQAETLKRITLNNTYIKKEESRTLEGTEDNESKLLLEGLRLLSAAGPALLNISGKLIRNSDIIENTRQSFFQRLIGFLSGKKPKNPSRIYNVIIFNAEDETGSKLKVDLNRFSAELQKEGNTLLSIGNKAGKIRMEIEQMPQEDIKINLEKHLKRVHSFLSIVPAVDQHLKDKANNAMRGSMSGIKLDLNDIQSCLIKSNKRRLEHEAGQKFGFV